MRLEAPTVVGCEEGVFPSPLGVGSGECAHPQKKNEFLCQNGEFWCILGSNYLPFSCLLYPNRKYVWN